MTPEQFAFWLNGFVELNGGTHPSPEQWQSIKEHLGEVFTKVTPPVGMTTPVDICRSCGRTRDNHKVRHLFVSSANLTADERFRDELVRTARRTKSGWEPIPSPVYPGRIC